MTKENASAIIAGFLAGRRQKAGRTQREIADFAGKHVQYVCNIERGYAPASPEMIVAYAKLCKIPKNDLLRAILDERKDWAKRNIIEQMNSRRLGRN
jgi:transcriptional regulator with XRE-family HTH domain